MRFATPLIPATLIRRYKRFLADMRLEEGREVTAHCPNPGGMLGLAEPGMRVWLEPNDNPKTKLDYGWRLVEVPGAGLVGIDTGLPNRIVGEALAARAVPELAAYGTIRPEVKYGAKSRVDFLLSEPGLPDLYLEVKNVHFRRSGDWAEFPDSPTARGARHLEELSDMVRAGHRAMMLYLIQRTDCASFKVAADYDPAYARAFEAALEAGVEMLAYATRISTDDITIGPALPVAETVIT